jgi:hypothetical protein
MGVLSMNSGPYLPFVTPLCFTFVSVAWSMISFHSHQFPIDHTIAYWKLVERSVQCCSSAVYLFTAQFRSPGLLSCTIKKRSPTEVRPLQRSQPTPGKSLVRCRTEDIFPYTFPCNFPAEGKISVLQFCFCVRVQIYAFSGAFLVS